MKQIKFFAMALVCLMMVAVNAKADDRPVPVQSLPAAIVPAAIAAYVKATFPNTVITKIDKERYGYEIELSNDIELKFNHAGVMMAIDN